MSSKTDLGCMLLPVSEHDNVVIRAMVANIAARKADGRQISCLYDSQSNTGIDPEVRTIPSKL